MKNQVDESQELATQTFEKAPKRSQDVDAAPSPVKNVADAEPCGCVGLGFAVHFCPLHAAAPDLYAALKEMVGVEYRHGSPAKREAEFLAAVVNARAALALANGQRTSEQKGFA